ncbi:MAG: hypothetical protein ABRQ37_16605 [Candidatus Eremiobacterota bacterium]
MQIQKTGLATQLPNTVKVTQKETGPKEQVVLGSSEPTPEFMKPLANQTSGPVGALGCAALGGAAGVGLGMALGGVKGAVDAAIGYGATAFFGPTGGVVATVGMGVLGAANGFKEGMKKKDGSQIAGGRVIAGAVGGLSNAAATWMGATHNFWAGVGLGALVTGAPAAAILGGTLALGGGIAGGIAGGA